MPINTLATLKATGITLNVQANDLDGSIESADDFSALVTALNEVKTAAGTASQAAVDARKAVTDANNALSDINAEETKIIAAEGTREGNETGRQSAESARTTAETARATAEQNRAAAENVRVTAENKRVTDSQTAITDDNAAADRANTAAKNAEDAIAGQLDPSIDSRIAAKTGVSGGIMGYDDAHAHISDGDIHVTAAQKIAWTAKAERSSTSTASVSASAWTGSAAPYSATVSVTGGKPEPTRIEVQPTNDATAEQWAAWRAALIRGGGQDTDKITLIADGDKPTIDIPIIATIRGDVQ